MMFSDRHYFFTYREDGGIKFRRSFLLGIFLSVLFVNASCFADGVFIPPVRKRIPDIPVQRALIKYRGVTESLMIESTLSGEAGEYAWIIPTPSQPQKIQKTTPGLLKTLSVQTQPEVHHYNSERQTIKMFGIPVSYIFALGMVMIGAVYLHKGIIISLAWLMVLLVLFAIIAPNFMTYRDRAGMGSGIISQSGVKIINNEIVGSYELFVLKASNGQELNTWLLDRGFRQFDEKAIAIIDDYISRNWIFSVARLNVSSDGTATPHPILLEFETERPVYPMRLTAVPDSTVELELFIMADQEPVSVNYKLSRDYCGEFNAMGDYQSRKIRSPAPFEGLFYLGTYKFRSRSIKHKGALKMMWNGCVITKLTGGIAGDKMNDDVFFDFKPSSPYESKLYTSEARRHEAGMTAYVTTLIVYGIGLIILRRYFNSRKFSGSRKPAITVFIIVLCITWGFVFTGSYASMDETDDIVMLPRGSWWHYLETELEDAGVFDGRVQSIEELVDLIEKEKILNPLSGRPVLIEDSPGNLVIEEGDEGSMVLKFCLESGELAVSNYGEIWHKD